MSKSQLDFSKHRDKACWRTYIKSQPSKATSNIIQIKKQLSHSQIPFPGIEGIKMKKKWKTKQWVVLDWKVQPIPLLLFHSKCTVQMQRRDKRS